MYKIQMKFQKIVALLCIIAVAAAFVYSLGISTDMYDAFNSTMQYPDKPERDLVDGARIFYDMQDFNRLYVNTNVVLIVIACTIFLSNTHNRRRYYIGNYACIALYSGTVIAANIWAHDQIAAFTEQFKTTVDFEALKAHAEKWGTLYLGPNDTFLFDLHYVIVGLCGLAVVLLIANMIWKILLMRSEKALIEAGEEAAV